MNLYGQAIVSGILVGGLYAMMSLGMSLSWGVLKIINLAHFAFTLLAGYVTYELATRFDLDPFVGILVVVPIFFAVGAALQWFFEKVRISEFNSLLVTFALLLILESVAGTIWSADFRQIPVAQNPYVSTSWFLGDIALQIPRLAAFGTAIVLTIGTMLLLERSFFGKAVRALAEDRDMATAFGVNSSRISITLAGMASAFAAIAGVFVAMSQAIFPSLAMEWFGIVFSVVILGGLGSTLGALAAGIIIGVVASISTVVAGPSTAPLITFVILILTLLFRPTGLFGRRVV
jgi:branched-chain amino acid transport system permease protein